MTRTAPIAGCLLLFSASAASAQQASPIATDRPGFAFNTGTVDKGVTQVELGLPQVTEIRSGSGTTRLFSAVGLLRVGVAPRWEIRLGAPMYTWLRTTGPGPGVKESGFGDLEMGAKAHVLDASGRRPAICLIPSVIVPTGGDGFTAADPGATFNATFEWVTKSSWSLKALTGVARLGTPGGDRYDQITAAFVAGHAMGSSRWSGYMELGGADTDIAGSGPARYLGGGLAVLTSHDVQIDLYVDRGLTDDSSDWLYGVGVSARF